ncbi:CDP-diacylglycerol--glycerol-3-phosphate 3-phosphatidyltransferase [Nocardioides terrisoli]|uniref:CDP-diacylglycerol--glycerol-3-phosphate 3-phosphatidyltransferase n=1 Tax=Nocardioides terrisoli TaxID=3388267 RepID=UPI00287BB932|nr:CDP-diacylglycerol--glycerol-3-phosphate 3-phosphatidyltransferase [Nocardioides marmorisolisilvae]
MSDGDQALPAVSNWNVPNALTTFRILMVPVFGWALLHDGGHDNAWRWLAYGLFALAMVTDKIDGDLARKHNLVTDFGKIADPIADKAITGMAFIGLSVIGELWWWVTVVVLVREWTVTLARLSIARRVVMAASRSGKAKTMAQGIALGGFVGPFRHLSGAWDIPGDVVWWLAAVLMALAFVLTLTSGAEFVSDVVRHRRRPTPPSA